MTRLLALCVSERVSGGERYLLALLGALQLRGWTVAVAGTPGSGLDLEAREFGVRFVPTALGPKLGRRTALRTVRHFPWQAKELDCLVTQQSPDVLVLQYKLEQLLVGHRHLAPTTAVIEHGPIPTPIKRVPGVRGRYLALLHQAAAVYAASTPAQHDLATLGIDSVLLPAGVTPPRAAVPVPRARRGIYAGRLEPNKGVVEAIELVLRSDGFSLTIAGSGSQAEEVAALAAQHPDRLVFVGQVSNIGQLISSCDFGLMLSSDPGEGRPLFALECLAQGRPVLASPATSAMQALAQEFKNSGVHLLDPTVMEEGQLNDRWISPVAARWTSWDATAEHFERSLLR